jgi:DNA-binding response OmpR family regulator
MASILVIEDDDRFRSALKEMLSRSDYDVLLAPNGKVGVELYREKHPDLVITDVIMPEKGGVQVINDLERGFPGVKIIAISGGIRNDADEYIDLVTAFTSVTHTFEKPFAMNDLLEVVKEMIG